MQDIGDRLKSYEPLWENWYKDSYINGGNFGRVYKLKRDFYGETIYSAVKIIPIVLEQELAAKKVNKDRIIEDKKKSVVQEIKNMYKLSEFPYLVHCLADSIKDIYDESDNIVGFDVLIQMSYYTTLTKYMKETGELNLSEIEKLAYQIGKALKSMHDINMLHRDVKVENIYMDDNGDFLLGDFGVSKQVESSNYSTMAGTPPFIAPEVWKVQQTNKRYVKTADIYSFGITLYYLLNDNMLPLVDENSTQNEIEAAVFDRLNGKAFPAPKNGSEKLKAIVMKCCEYEPDDRYQSMQEILNELETQEKPFVIHEENKPDHVEDEKSEATETDDIKETPIAETAETFATVYADNDTENIESIQEYETVYANEKETLDNADKKKDTKSHDDIKANKKHKSIKKSIAVVLTIIILLGSSAAILNTVIDNDSDISNDSTVNSNIAAVKFPLTYDSVPKGTISAGNYHTVGVKSDGAVIAIGNNTFGQCDVSDWTNIVAISARFFHTLGLKSNGTVVAVGENYNGQCDVSYWTDIVAISTGVYHTVGLKSDGTVVAVGEDYIGQCNVSNWTDIVSISAGWYHTVGLKSDGTVVAVGGNGTGKCDVSDWTDIIAVSAGYKHTVGLKSDGTVVAVGDDQSGQCDVSDWTDIVAVSAGYSHTVGLKSDGTVVAVGSNYNGKCDVSDWTDIVAISAGDDNTVGLKSDGTVVAVGSNDDGQCDVSHWTDIKKPND